MLLNRDYGIGFASIFMKVNLSTHYCSICQLKCLRHVEVE